MAVTSEFTIPLTVFVPIMGVFLTGFLGFLTWLVKRHVELASIQSSMLQQLIMLKETDAEHHERLTYLERRTSTDAVRVSGRGDPWVQA